MNEVKCFVQNFSLCARSSDASARTLALMLHRVSSERFPVLAQVEAWARERTVTLRFKAQESCSFIRQATRKVEGSTEYVRESIFGGRENAFTVLFILTRTQRQQEHQDAQGGDQGHRVVLEVCVQMGTRRVSRKSTERCVGSIFSFRRKRARHTHREHPTPCQVSGTRHTTRARTRAVKLKRPKHCPSKHRCERHVACLAHALEGC
jgi:hypothetical protein